MRILGDLIEQPSSLAEFSWLTTRLQFSDSCGASSNPAAAPSMTGDELARRLRLASPDSENALSHRLQRPAVQEQSHIVEGGSFPLPGRNVLRSRMGIPSGRVPSSVVEHVTFNHGVLGSIPGGPITTLPTGNAWRPSIATAAMSESVSTGLTRCIWKPARSAR